MFFSPLVLIKQVQIDEGSLTHCRGFCKMYFSKSGDSRAAVHSLGEVLDYQVSDMWALPNLETVQSVICFFKAEVKSRIHQFSQWILRQD